MKYAVIQFNNGNGALLCNNCNSIIDSGFDHEDKIYMCEDCKRMRVELGESMFHDQYEFLQAGDVPVGTERAEILAANLVEEEFDEWMDEPMYLDEGCINAIKEALDLMYVTAQYLNVTIGPDKAKECWDALHANNMSKCTNGKLLKREDGKVLKPEGYEKLDLSTVLCDNP